MVSPPTPPPAATRSRFPLVFELLIWVLYVGVYKYNHYLLQATALRRPSPFDAFPYAQLILFAAAASVYLIPYYRWLAPGLLERRRYVLLVLASAAYLWAGIKFNTLLAAILFRPLASSPTLHQLYNDLLHLGLSQLTTYGNAQLMLLLQDWLAFSCVAFVRYAFEHEWHRHQAEQAHLTLQLEQLKMQLQPHFLFNTLNSIYGLSLAGSPDTPRFILLLSELMRYVLYESGRPYLPLAEEAGFLEHYFELEQRKYPQARIRLATLDGGGPGGTLLVPPLLLLPLVENAFKHGRHHATDAAGVEATLTTAPTQLCFRIENDMLPTPPPAAARRSGGIGLENLRQRLHLYYPHQHTLSLTQDAGRYCAELLIHLPG